jgi:TPR repeat protein
MLVGITEAQVLRKIELRKLTAVDVKALEEKARHGERRSMTIVGIALAEGRGVPANQSLAVTWLQKASKTDDIAQEYLATMLRSGVGVPQDQTQARGLYAKAAGQGNRRAQFNYASMCFNGEGGAQDVDSAAKYFEIAARQGDAEAQHMIGRMYQYGRGVVQDYAQATRWYEEAAKQNFAPSIFALGIAYLDGTLGVRDEQLGERYLDHAASLGVWAAAVRIANLYLTGESVPQNEAVAYKWFAIANELSGVQSNPSTASLEGKLEAPQLASAKQEVSEWKAMHLNLK